jgi:hypothetical protein
MKNGKEMNSSGRRVVSADNRPRFLYWTKILIYDINRLGLESISGNTHMFNADGPAPISYRNGERVFQSTIPPNRRFPTNGNL